MKVLEFHDYKTRHRAVIRKVLASAAARRLDEAAFPAYSHKNPAINWLFWQRLKVVIDHIEGLGRFRDILDFGTGSGVMLPFLAARAERVIAMDIDLHPLELVQAEIPLPRNVEVVDGQQKPIRDYPPGSFDLIVALDVLEHLHELPVAIGELVSRLRPGGQLVVSGPTENALYKLGRKLAGPEYSGAYHERGIAEIRAELARHAQVEQIATLYYPLPLFEVFTGKV